MTDGSTQDAAWSDIWVHFVSKLSPAPAGSDIVRESIAMLINQHRRHYELAASLVQI